MGLTREELRRLREIERHLAAEEPGLDRALRGRPVSPYLVWARALGVVWLPIMLIGDATRQVTFAVAGIAVLLTALTLALIALTR